MFKPTASACDDTSSTRSPSDGGEYVVIDLNDDTLDVTDRVTDARFRPAASGRETAAVGEPGPRAPAAPAAPSLVDQAAAIRRACQEQIDAIRRELEAGSSDSDGDGDTGNGMLGPAAVRGDQVLAPESVSRFIADIEAHQRTIAEVQRELAACNGQQRKVWNEITRISAEMRQMQTDAATASHGGGAPTASLAAAPIVIRKHDILTEANFIEFRNTLIHLAQLTQPQLMELVGALPEMVPDHRHQGGGGGGGGGAAAAPHSTDDSSRIHEAISVCLKGKLDALRRQRDALENQSNILEQLTDEDTASDAGSILVCPLTLAPMKHPVIVNDHFYEKESIEGYIRAQTASKGVVYDPLNRDVVITEADVRKCHKVSALLRERALEALRAPIESQVNALLTAATNEVRRYLSAVYAQKLKIHLEEAESSKAALSVYDAKQARIDTLCRVGSELDEKAKQLEDQLAFHRVEVSRLETAVQRHAEALSKTHNNTAEAAQAAANRSAAKSARRREAQRRADQHVRELQARADAEIAALYEVEHTAAAAEAAAAAAAAAAADQDKSQRKPLRSERGCAPRGQTFHQHDSASTRCTICGTDFTTLNRRHHCRLCGHLVCQLCSTKLVRRRNVIGEDWPVRCCDCCFRQQHELPPGERSIHDEEPAFVHQLRVNALPMIAVHTELVTTNFVVPALAHVGSTLVSTAASVLSSTFSMITGSASSSAPATPTPTGGSSPAAAASPPPPRKRDAAQPYASPPALHDGDDFDLA